MGFNKRYLPELSDLKKECRKMGPTDFIKDLEKYDSLIGSTECHAFIEKTIIKNKTKNHVLSSKSKI